MSLLFKFAGIVLLISLIQTVSSFYWDNYNSYFSNFGFNNFGFRRASYKLSYFNITGRAEFIRWIFACNYYLLIKYII